MLGDSEIAFPLVGAKEIAPPQRSKNLNINRDNIKKIIDGQENVLNKQQLGKIYLMDTQFFIAYNRRLSKEILVMQRQLGADAFSRDLISNEAKREASSNPMNLHSWIIQSKDYLSPLLEKFDEKIMSHKEVFDFLDGNEACQIIHFGLGV